MSKSNLKIELDRAGVRELLRSEEMRAACEEQGQRILGNLGPGYEKDSFVGKNRVNVEVRTADMVGIMDNLNNNSLLKAIK